MKSLSKKLILGTVGICIATATVVAGENLVKSGGAEDTASVKKWHKALSQNTEDKVAGKASFHGKIKDIWSYSPGFIEVDTSKAYKLSASLKTAGTDKSKCYIGIISYDVKKRTIQRPNITITKGSFSTLAADAKVGDKVLQVKDCSKWNKRLLARSQVAFNAIKDYSDLPNYNLTNRIVKLEKKGDIYEITLKTPIKGSFKAGSGVRQHMVYGGYQYCAASGKVAPDKWTKYSAVIKGQVKYGAPNEQFWPGTKYVKIVVILNYVAKKDSDTQALFDEVMFSQLD